jgi:hypothetical protein
MTSECGESLAGTVFHEMVHAHGCELGSANHGSDPNDRVFACEEACFPGATGGRGVASVCR